MTTIQDAFFAILTQCDGAHAQDGCGFNAADASPARRLARRAESDTWGSYEDYFAWQMLRKYAGQLREQGIDYTAIPEPPKPARGGSSRYVCRVADKPIFRFAFEYGERQFDSIKSRTKSLPAQWNSTQKVWDVNYTTQTRDGILALIDDYDFELSPGAIELLSEAPPAPAAPPKPKRTIAASGKQWLVQWGKGDPDFDTIKTAVAALRGRKWNPDRMGWECNTSLDLLAICDKYDFTGREALRTALDSRAAKIVTELTGEQEARLAAITEKLLPYQIPAVRSQTIALQNGGTLDASDTGTGKTYIALAVCAVLNRPAYVVCPKAVIPSWQRCAAHFGINLAGICNYETLTRGNQAEVSKSGTERVSFAWKLPTETVIVIDECHRLKDGKTLNNKLGMAALKQGYAVFGLSATAADNPMQMKFSGTLTGLFEDGEHWDWALAHGVRQLDYGYKFCGGLDTLAKIHSQIFPKRGFRLRIKDLGDSFPESQISAETYNLNGAAKEIDSIYAEMKAELKRLKAKEAEDGDPIPLTIRLRARQQVELLKVPAIVEMVEDAVESGMSVAVFVNFNETADALCEKLKTRCVIRGGQSAEDREANIAAFQADREPVIVCNIKAGGVGVSLHGSPEARTRLSIICPTDSGQDLKQALGRVWRANGAKSIQRIFFAAGTVEEKVCANVNAKIARIDALNDGFGVTDEDLNTNV